jgi:hypothetical protein
MPGMLSDSMTGETVCILEHEENECLNQNINYKNLQELIGRGGVIDPLLVDYYSNGTFIIIYFY